MPLPSFEIMGIVNLTVDSFSDGGRFYKPDCALKHIKSLIEDGANYIDLGAESTRPGAKKIPLEEEWAKLKDILVLLDKRNLGDIKISVDTRKPEIIRRLLDYKVDLINHIAEKELSETILKALAQRKISYLAMHIHKEPESMQQKPLDEKRALQEVSYFFSNLHKKLIQCGFSKEQIWFDPGIGFGKTDQANLSLLNEVKNFSKDYNMLLGISRKSFLGRLLNINEPLDRDKPSKILELALSFLGAKIIRTHDVRNLVRLKLT